MPGHKNPVAVAVSGGLDSLLALALLAQEGRAVAAAWARLLPDQDPQGRTREFLERVCRKLGLPLMEIDLHESFDQLVISPFLRGYLQGRTPNPCALCNPRIKFGLLFEQLCQRLELPDLRLATGHYAAIRHTPESGAVLARAVDSAKDQSYFLALLPKAILTRLTFPLASLRKQDAPGLLRTMGLPLPDDKESQEICFIPQDDYRSFIRQQAQSRALALPGPGPVLLPDGQIVGEHQGLWRYTQGQRRGLGVSWKHPLYVLGKDVARNALLVGAKEQRRAAGCVLEDVNLLVPLQHWPATVLARLRYRQQPQPVHVTQTEQGLRLLFADPQTEAADGPPAPGQLGVCYSPEGLVLAGGIISHALGTSPQTGELHA